jgi:hypothetical protein
MSVTEYIDRDEIWRALDDAQCRYVKKIEKAIEGVPAADVRPVKRGKWKTVMLDHEQMGCRPTANYCSECHQITWFRTFYCPNCGADMREG